MSQRVDCQRCGKSFHKDMRLCPFCGEENKGEIVQKVLACPRCHIPLKAHTYQQHVLNVCPECSGIWLDTNEFKRLTSERDVYQDESIPYEYKKKPLSFTEKPYIVCPCCGSLMTRKNFLQISGVLIDLCRDHGVWLDSGELEQLRCFIANGGLEENQNKEIIKNRLEIESMAATLDKVEFIQWYLNHWKLKHLLIK